MATRIAPHAYPVESGILYEASGDAVRMGAASYPLEGFDRVSVVDRLATKSNWSSIAQEGKAAQRMMFYSINGGVGRSTALAATALKLAQQGKRVLALDLDLQSSGLSSGLLSFEDQPTHGVTDWLVEDLVNNGDDVLESMIATNASPNGKIYVVPAYGANPGEYIAKLGRVWMPKTDSNGAQETLSARLQRLLQTLEERTRPDVVLIDSCAGINDLAASCETDMGAHLILLFAKNNPQTWSGYRILFDHWRHAGVAAEIREKLQIVAAPVSGFASVDYLADLREHAYDLFLETLYDEVAPSEVAPSETGAWSFDLGNDAAPHQPWQVRYSDGFAFLRTLHDRLRDIDFVHGDLIERSVNFLGLDEDFRGALKKGIVAHL